MIFNADVKYTSIIKLAMHGLKLNITITLLLLLATGMLLMNAIITILWQHSLVSEIIAHQQLVLSVIAQNTGADSTKIEKSLTRFTQETPDTCGAFLIRGDWQTLSGSQCSQSDGLHQIAAKAMKDGKPAASSTGTTMGILFPRQKYLHIAVPLLASPKPTGAIAVAYPLQPTWQTLRENQKIILVYILVNTLVLSVIGFFRLSSIILRPIDRLVQATYSYSAEQNPGFVAEHEENEFRSLSSAINSMVGRIDQDKISLQNTVSSLEQANITIRQNQHEMVRAEKLASVGRLSAGLAHEIGNPLGIVLGYLGLLQKQNLPRKERLEYIQRSEQELNRINTLVRQLLDFSRPLASNSEAVHIHEVLQDIVDMLQAQKKNRAITFAVHLNAQDDMVQGSKEAFRQAFVNFFLNALDAIHETSHPDKGTITVESKIIEDEPETNMLQIIITDNGCGIPSTHMMNIFDPFYTTKDPGKGTGLGLSVSYGILEKSGGTVHARSLDDQGTSIIIELPAIAPSQV